MFEKELKNLIHNEFEKESLDGLSQIPNALTTIAYRLDFKSGLKLVAKIGFDEKDIKKGKGLKEMSALKLANQIIGLNLSPKLIKYIDSYPGFPGYITFLELIEGVVLDAKAFNEVASSSSNLDQLVKILLRLHTHKSSTFSDLLPTGKRYIYEYFVSEHQDIKLALESAGIFTEVQKQYDDLPKVYDYFKDYSDFHFLHGDVNFKNILMSENEIKALIDWDRSLIGPIAFEFAHVSTLAAKYGVTKWHSSLIQTYLNNYDGESEKLYKEFRMVELFTYFKLLMRKLTHKHQKDAIEICVDTGEEFKDHLIRKIMEYEF
jgi:thiamine kinase-like enzyme